MVTQYEPEVYDLNGERRDLAWLRATYGAVYVPAPLTGPRMALAQIHITEGPATVTVRCQDGDAPLPSHAVALSWPDAPEDLTSEAAQAFKTRYKPRAVVQWTDVNGYTGFGLGGGSYTLDLSVGGPHAVWVLHNLYFSDVLDRVGMLGNTNHRGPLQLVFALSAAVGTVPDPEPDPDDLATLARIYATVKATGAKLDALAAHLGA